MMLRRLRSVPTTPRTAFVLGGGGNLGAIQVGMLTALLERGVRPDFVVGCSVGAINGTAIAADPSTDGVQRLVDIWAGLDGEAICPPGRLSHLRLLSRRGPAMQSNDGLRRLLAEHLPHQLFEELPLPVHVVATSLRTGRERWFSSGPVIDPVLASAALPAVFPPVTIAGETFIDGGVVDNVPITKAVALGASRIFVLHVGNFDRPRPTPKRPIDVLLQSYSIARDHRFLSDAQADYPGVELVVLPGVDPGNVRYNDFSRSTQLIERGRAATAAFLEAKAASSAG